MRRLLTAAAFMLVAPAWAADAAPSGVLALSASASVEVTQDLLSVALATTREGADAAGVQSALKAALDAALAEARRAAKPGQLEVRTGNFALYPRHGERGGITGWQGSTELIVEGRDFDAIAQLTGRIKTLQIARVGYALSRESRDKAEAQVAQQAIASYRAKAADYAKQFSYASVVMREVHVTPSEPGFGPVPMLARAEKSTMADASLPVEAGKATVTVTVAGSVQMLK